MRIAPILLISLCLPAFSTAQSYTALTWNIRYDQPKDSLDRWDRRKQALVHEVLARKPQLIGLQEVLANQAAFLDGQWGGYQRFGVGRDDGKTSGEYSPVYFDTTVFTLLLGRTLWLSETPDRPGFGWDASCNRIATIVILRDKSTADSVWVVSTHWDYEGKESRKHSARLIHGELALPMARGKHVILMGDLNTNRSTEPLRFLRDRFADSCPRDQKRRGTSNRFKLRKHCFKRIDYIWLSPTNWEVLSYEVSHPRVNGRQVSDHFPVVVRLKAL